MNIDAEPIQQVSNIQIIQTIQELIMPKQTETHWRPVAAKRDAAGAMRSKHGGNWATRSSEQLENG